MKSSKSSSSSSSSSNNATPKKQPKQQPQQQRTQQWYYLSVIGIASLLSILSVYRFSSIAYKFMDDRINPQQQYYDVAGAGDDDDDDDDDYGDSTTTTTTTTTRSSSERIRRQKQKQHQKGSKSSLESISSLPTIQTKRLPSGKRQRQLPPYIRHIQQKQQKGLGLGGGSGGGITAANKLGIMSSQRNDYPTVVSVERKLDTTYEKSYTLTDGITKVTVGKQGDAVKNAIIYGMKQKNQGLHRSNWDKIETSICLQDDPSTSLLQSQKRPSPIKNTTTYQMQKRSHHNRRQLSFFSRLKSSSSSTLPAHPKNRNPQNPIEYLPQAILIGVQKGGTTALYKYLDEHPDIAKATKEIYFLDEKIDTFVSTKGIPRHRIQHAYGQQMQRALKLPQQDNNKLILDLTPNYMLYSDRLPQRIQCIVPTAKIFCLLRNPIDRARSQYDMKLRFHQSSAGMNQYNNHIPKTFDEYIKLDLRALQETGVIQDWTNVDFDLFFNSPASDEAWRTYINSGLNAPIGMGLYAMQLRYYKGINQQQQQNLSSSSSSSSFMAFPSEQLQYNTSQTFQRILDFLELPRQEKVEHYSKTINSSRKKETVSNETRDLLKQVFEPFNRKLGELLGGEWPDIVSNEWNN